MVISDTEFEASTSDEEKSGIGIAYTSGGMKLGIINNTKDNAWWFCWMLKK